MSLLKLIYHLVDSGKDIDQRIKLIRDDQEQELNLHLTQQSLIYKDEACYILVIRDISVHYNLKETKRNNKVLNLLTNSVSRELLTPISCVVAVGQNINQNEEMSKEELQE